LSLKPIY